MAMCEVLKFRLECDGEHPRGGRCPCDVTVEATSREDAEARVLSFGWYHDARGWVCNAGGGHRGDPAVLRRRAYAESGAS